ncbi:MAG: PEP-CTERM sorting domain-containing protein [Pseudomonadota bacterium]
MKNVFIHLAGALLIAASAPASANFVGAYDVSNWTTTLPGDPAGGGGSMNLSDAPSSITMQGGDAGPCHDNPNCAVNFTIRAVNTGTVSFTWDYISYDDDGSKYDWFGFLKNGLFTPLSENSVWIREQSGYEIFDISAGDIFGFSLNCHDCEFFPANTTISNFTVVPEPASFALVGLGIVGLAVGRRKQAN